MKKTLEDVLLEENLVDEPGLRRLRNRARREKVSLATAAFESGALTPEAMAGALAKRLHLEVTAIEGDAPDDEALREVPHDLASSRLVLPLSLDTAERVLRVAMADPLDLDAIEELEESSGMRVDPVLARADVLAGSIRRQYRGVITKMIPRPERSATEPSDPREEPADAAALARVLEALIDQLADRGLVDRAALDATLARHRRS